MVRVAPGMESTIQWVVRGWDEGARETYRSDRWRRTHSKRTPWRDPWPLRARHVTCAAVVAGGVVGSAVAAGVVVADGVGVAGGVVAGGGGAGVGLAAVGDVGVVVAVAEVRRLSFVGAPDGLRSPLATRF